MTSPTTAHIGSGEKKQRGTLATILIWTLIALGALLCFSWILGNLWIVGVAALVGIGYLVGRKKRDSRRPDTYY